MSFSTGSALEQIEQAARGGDQHVDAAVQGFFLIKQHGLATDEQRHLERMVLAVDFGDLGGLAVGAMIRLRACAPSRASEAPPGRASSAW